MHKRRDLALTVAIFCGGVVRALVDLAAKRACATSR